MYKTVAEIASKIRGHVSSARLADNENLRELHFSAAENLIGQLERGEYADPQRVLATVLEAKLQASQDDIGEKLSMLIKLRDYFGAEIFNHALYGPKTD